jgi:carbonic anhydrase
VPLVVVLGHERCGAVDAALSVVENNTVFPGSLNQMIEPILPAALMARSTGAKGEALLDAAVRENIRRVVTRIKNSGPVLMNPIKTGQVKVVGARYDLDDGDVDFFV